MRGPGASYQRRITGHKAVAGNGAVLHFGRPFPDGNSIRNLTASVSEDTRSVFGEYISIYDIQRAVEDKVTVTICHESRLAKLELPEAENPEVDVDFEDATEGDEIERRNG